MWLSVAISLLCFSVYQANQQIYISNQICELEIKNLICFFVFLNFMSFFCLYVFSMNIYLIVLVDCRPAERIAFFLSSTNILEGNSHDGIISNGWKVFNEFVWYVNITECTSFP